MRRNRFSLFATGLAGSFLCLATACNSLQASPTPALQGPASQPPTAQANLQPATPTASASSPASNCTPAESITGESVGNTLCVTGTVHGTSKDSLASYVDFGAKFYLLSYDVDLTGIPRGDCIRVSGKIASVGSRLLMVVLPKTTVTDCVGQPYPLRAMVGQSQPTAAVQPSATAANAGPTSTQPSAPTAAAPTPTSAAALPTATDTPLPLILQEVSLSSPIPAGAYANLVIHYAPGATCSLTFTTPDGTVSTAPGLGQTTADGSGNCRWIWKIDKNTAKGTGSLSVSVNNGAAGASFGIEIQ